MLKPNLSRRVQSISEAQVVSVDTDKKEIVVNEKKDGAYTEKEEYKVLDGIKLAGLENAIVKLWVKSGKVLDITVKSTVKYDYIAKINGKTDKVQVKDLKDIKLLNEGKTYDIALNDKDDVIAKVYKDGSKLPYESEKDDEKLASGLFAKFVLNGDEIVTIEAYDPQEAGLIKDVKDSKLVYTKGNRTKTIRDLDDAKKMIVVINGEAAEYKDLEEGMYFDYKEYASDKYIIVATDKKVEGEFDRIDNDDRQIRIDGDYIDVADHIYMSTDEGEHYGSAISDLDKLDSLFDEDVVALKNNKGKIAYIAADVEEDTTTFYGFVVAKSNFDKKIRVEKVVDDKIKEVTYEVSIPSSDDNSKKFDQLNVYDSKADKGENPKQASKLNAFYKFTINEDEEIVKAEKVSSLSDYTAKEFSSKYDYIKVEEDANKIYVDNAVMFEVKKDGTVEYVKWEDIEKTAGNNLGIKFKADKVKANVVLITDSNNVSLGETKEYKVAFVLDRDKIASSGYKYEYEVATPDGTETYKAKEQKDENTVVVYELLSDDQIKIVANAVYDKMSSIASNDKLSGKFEAINGKVVAGTISGSYLDIKEDGADSAKTYRVADDALVYRVEIKDKKAKFEEADLSDISDEEGDEDYLYCLMEDGVVKVLFFKAEESK